MVVENGHLYRTRLKPDRGIMELVRVLDWVTGLHLPTTDRRTKRAGERSTAHAPKMAENYSALLQERGHGLYAEPCRWLGCYIKITLITCRRGEFVTNDMLALNHPDSLSKFRFDSEVPPWLIREKHVHLVSYLHLTPSHLTLAVGCQPEKILCAAPMPL